MKAAAKAAIVPLLTFFAGPAAADWSGPGTVTDPISATPTALGTPSAHAPAALHEVAGSTTGTGSSGSTSTATEH